MACRLASWLATSCWMGYTDSAVMKGTAGDVGIVNAAGDVGDEVLRMLVEGSNHRGDLPDHNSWSNKTPKSKIKIWRRQRRGGRGGCGGSRMRGGGGCRKKFRRFLAFLEVFGIIRCFLHFLHFWTLSGVFGCFFRLLSYHFL